MIFPNSSEDKNRLPLITALLQLNSAGRFSWHMPGHHNGRQWPEWLRSNLHLLDTTELSGSDDLLAPEGPARQSLEQVSILSGAAWSRYLTAGSTSGILSMLAACPGRGGRILMSRVCHQSVMHAAALLDLNIVWIKPSLWPEAPPENNEPMTLLPQISLADVQLAAANGDFDAVFLTSPDYYGSCAEIAAISEFAHANNASVLVDEAHGAHLSLEHLDLPASAMRQGADICVQSLHKTLPALTSAAVIHVSVAAVSSNRIDLQRLESSLKIFHTSSPSFVIAATAEYAEYWLHEHAADQIDNTISRIKALAGDFEGMYNFAPVDRSFNASVRAGRDPLRIVISHTDGRHIGPTANSLISRGIDLEMYDMKRIVLIPALDQTSDEFVALAAALEFAAEDHRDAGQIHIDKSELQILDQIWRQMISDVPEQAVCPGNAMLKMTSQKQVSFETAAGMISASAIVPYPPGIPLVWPGEKLSSEKLAFIKNLGENGINLIGLSNKKVHVLC